MRLAPYLLAAPLAFVLAAFLLVPMAVILVVSVFDYDSVRLIPDVVATNYADVLLSPVTWRTYLNTLKYTVMVWVVCVLVGVPVALFLAFCVRGAALQSGLFLVCTVPFLTSNVIRMISWIPVLGRNGLVQLDADAQLGHHPQRPIDVAALLGFRRRARHGAPLHAVYGDADLQHADARIDRSLDRSGRATPAPAPGPDPAATVILPLAKPGMAIGTIFVVTLVMADFSTVQPDERRPECLGWR